MAVIKDLHQVDALSGLQRLQSPVVEDKQLELRELPQQLDVAAEAFA